MKKLFSFFIIILFSILGNAQTTAIPDTNFEQALINLGLDNTAYLLGAEKYTDNFGSFHYLYLNFLKQSNQTK